ncbi:MFS transporter [Fredinandcohnia sp. QZ13]|uniref:MFS transporter n=1 Tax=Fredinandcohnia sp. QZ13 TaxID=3073144 RepID=UPI0028532590|nr:MFS transporter [Fredinandcohnia sp. QZ13]MDR4889792.1 MFS transporter [Fredinandcohnia sp. QZ13]
MDKRIYFLMVIAFVIGMVELIISGILDLIAEDLHVTLGQAGLLITVFAVIFAVASPILLVMTAKIERKRLMLVCLYIFLIGCIVTVFAPIFSILFIGRIILALSGALLIILCLVMAPSLAGEQYKGRAIGIVSMGVSASLVLGVPIGLILGDKFGWRAPFVLITVLTALSIIGVHVLMGKIQPKPQIPLRQQLKAFKNHKITLGLSTTFFYMTGHSILYTYFKPYLEANTDFNGNWISVIYLIFGVSAVFGGGIGGVLADLLGSRKTMVIALIVFSALFFVFPYTTDFYPMFFIILIVWGILSWAISPAMQSYLIEIAPESSEIQQSLNNSSLHLGVAVGSVIGAGIVDTLSVNVNPYVAGIFIILSLVTVVISVRSKEKNTYRTRSAS